jgi:hypothetical protein
VYHDETEDRYYASRRDYERMQILTRIQRGELRPVEGFTRYTITHDGLVVNIQRARAVRAFMNQGRAAISLVSDEGFQKTLGLARLIASHFHGRPEDQDQYFDVVHSDGDLSNFHPGNLVWVARWKRHANPENYDVDIS